MQHDPRQVLASEPMGRLQFVAVFLCILLVAIDGFDVLSISFAAPGIADEWGIDRAALGLVLSMELIGMGFGSLLIGHLADHWGRRPVTLLCLVVMAAGMAGAATADDLITLSIYRVATGLGIGGTLASINALAAEFANDRHRSLAVSLMAGGYPIGAVIGGAIVSALLLEHDWRSVFVFGAVATSAFIPLVWFLLPESVAFLCERRPQGALARVNIILSRLGHDPVASLPDPPPAPARVGLAELFAPGMARTTGLLTLAYFAHIMTFYFIIKWIPKLVVDMGFPAPQAGSVLVWFNIGGLTGSIAFGLLSQGIELRRLLTGFMLATVGAVVLFGQGPTDLMQLSAMAALSGFFANAAVVGLYALFAQTFPTSVRAGGTGFAIGVGRGGAALGPVVAGMLFVAGGSLASVALVMATGSLIACFALIAHGRPANDRRPA